MRYFFLLAACFLTNFGNYTLCQNFGIGTTTPAEKLEVVGAIKLGNTTKSLPGTIRWTGTDFEGYDGKFWRSLTQAPSKITHFVKNSLTEIRTTSYTPIFAIDYFPNKDSVILNLSLGGIGIDTTNTDPTANTLLVKITVNGKDEYGTIIVADKNTARWAVNLSVPLAMNRLQNAQITVAMALNSANSVYFTIDPSRDIFHQAKLSIID